MNQIQTNRNKVSLGTVIGARVTISGSKNPNASGWAYSQYVASSCPSGYRYVRRISKGYYPSKINYQDSLDFESSLISEGMLVVRGRPIAGKNAPLVSQKGA